MEENKDAPKPTGDEAEVLDLGADFEVITEEPATPEPAAPAAVSTAPGKGGTPAAGPAPGAPGGAAADGAPILRSVAGWTNLGLGVAVAGLLGPWGPGAGANLLHGLLLAWSLWFFLTRGFGAVRPPGGAGGAGPLLPALLAVYGLARTALAGSGSLEGLLGWSAGGTLPDSLGAVLTLLGGALALAAPSLGGKKDAKLPAPQAPGARDAQFSQSLLAYLLVLVGVLMPWGSGLAGRPEHGADSVFGSLTLLCTVLTLWASWVGYWKLWTMPVVTGRLGLMLFLAPLEAVLLGLAGIARHTVQRESGWVFDSWPGDPAQESFLAHGAGALLCLAGGALGLWVLVHGTRAAMAMAKERKAQEVAARKAAREQRKGSGAAKGK